MEQKKRSEMAAKDTWRLEDMFPSNEKWEEVFRRASEELKNVGEYQGKLSDPAMLKKAFDLIYCLSQDAEALYTYARMRRDEDNNVTTYQAMVGRAQTLLVSFETHTAFVAPELLSLPAEYLESAKRDPAMADYRMHLDNVARRRAHTLSAEEERIVAMTGEMASAPSTVYDMLTDADMKFPTITGEDGQKVEITQSNYIPLVMSKNRDVRKAAFEGLYTTFRGYSATIPAIYSSSVKADQFAAQTGKYISALEAAMYPDNIPTDVYHNLIDAVHRHLDGLNRFVTRNGQMIGVDKMHMYDVYTPPTKGFDINLPFDKAYDMVVDCLGVLGEDYQAVLRKALHDRWIDPYPNAGKSSGAYSWGTYASHPYVLMNYHEDLDGMQTIAHEMGHSMHTYYSAAAQPYPLAEYSLFVAEVASTVNEVLVLMELLERYPEKDAQAYLLYNLLDSYRTTLFRQTMFAEFELASHEMAEKGEALTVDSLNEVYAALNGKYYASIEQDEQIAYEWMRIPHFYRAFYVYKYATGFSAAMALASKIRREGKNAVDAYKKFLSAGCSLYPIDALKLAGIDMSRPEPVEEALQMFETLLDRYVAATD